MNYSVIDTEKWERREHCDFFRGYVLPQYGMSFELDVTDFRKYVKNRGLSFTLSFIHAVALCASDIENFRYRFLDKKAVLFDEVNVSFTYLCDNRLFKAVKTEMIGDMENFVLRAKENAAKQKDYFADPGVNAFFFTSVPWVSFTGFSHTASGRPNNGSPLFDFGKYREENGRLKMPFTVTVHHSFVDGYHIGLLAERLQKFLDSFGQYNL